MEIPSALSLANALGSVASVSALILAIIQTRRYREIRRRDESDLWDAVEVVRKIIVNLDESKAARDNVRAGKAYSGAARLHRLLLRILAMRERIFDERVIQRWEAGGKLRTKYHRDDARKCMDVPRKTIQRPDTANRVAGD